METLFILVCTFVVSIYEIKVLQQTEKNEPILFSLCSLACIPFVSQDRFWFTQLFFTFLFCLFEQDRHTFYISRNWLIPCICIIICFIMFYKQVYGIASLLYSVPALLLHRRHPEWIGIADVYFLCFFGLLLGIHRMMIAVLISIVFGLFWIILKQNKMIPYVSCLCVGVWISYLKGYVLWVYLFNLISAF